MRKTERLREMISEAGQCGELMTLQVPLPLDPTVLLNGIIPPSCSVFKSAMAPIRLTFRVAGMWLYLLTARNVPRQLLYQKISSSCVVTAAQHRCLLHLLWYQTHV